MHGRIAMHRHISNNAMGVVCTRKAFMGLFVLMKNSFLCLQGAACECTIASCGLN